MFTLRFYKNREEGRTQTVVCCARYEVYERRNENAVVTITTHYKELEDSPGVDHNIGKHPNNQGSGGYYDVCYVENIAGKTIDTIRRSRVALQGDGDKEELTVAGPA